MVDNQEDHSTDLIINENQNESQNFDEKENNDEYIRITAAHQMLVEAQKYEEEKDYSTALQLYRICADFLLEELMFAEGTEESRIYLREKCTAIMDRIDLLKTKLEPIPISTEPITTNSIAPTDQIKSLQI